MEVEKKEKRIPFDKKLPYVFVSYNHDQQAFVTAFCKKLRETYNIWYDEELSTGDDWRDTITYHIAKCESFICFLSEDTDISKDVYASGKKVSENCLSEIYEAINAKAKIYPIYLDSEEDLVFPDDVKKHLESIHHIATNSNESLDKIIGNLAMHNFPKLGNNNCTGSNIIDCNDSDFQIAKLYRLLYWNKNSETADDVDAIIEYCDTLIENEESEGKSVVYSYACLSKLLAKYRLTKVEELYGVQISFEEYNEYLIRAYEFADKNLKLRLTYYLKSITINEDTITRAIEEYNKNKASRFASYNNQKTEKYLTSSYFIEWAILNSKKIFKELTMIPGMLKKLLLGGYLANLGGQYNDAFFEDRNRNYFTLFNKAFVYDDTDIDCITKNFFEENPNIVSVELPSSIETIEESAFEGLKNLEEIAIPPEVRSIEKNTFKGCIKLKAVYFQSSENLVKISDNAFNGCCSLAKIELPNSVEKIGAHAFQGCLMLQRIMIPQNVSRIGSYSFFGCSNLEKVDMKTEKILEIDFASFCACTKLYRIILPNSITKIGDDVFLGCESLEMIELPENLLELGNACFRGCTNLSQIEIPYSVSKLKNRVFKDCTMLHKITCKCSKEDWEEKIKSGQDIFDSNAKIVLIE